MSSNNAQQPTMGKQLGNIQEGALQGAKNITDTLGNVREGMNAQVKDFSTKASNFSTKEFLESNTLIAKLVFLLLVLIGFMILMYLGIALITYFFSSGNSPYLITGLNDGTNYKVIVQDPKNTQSVTVLRSNNKATGIEFTWSVWLKAAGVGSGTSPTYHIFSKGGNGNFDKSTGLMQINNGPGVYFTPGQVDTTNSAPSDVSKKQLNVDIYMNIATAAPISSDPATYMEKITITGVPIGSWFNLVIRLENKVMDVYINGTLTQRHVFTSVPLQNYDDVYVCGNGGFNGTLSDLRYFNRALNVFEINNIVAAGPNLSYTGGNKDAASQMSQMWYSMNANT